MYNFFMNSQSFKDPKLEKVRTFEQRFEDRDFFNSPGYITDLMRITGTKMIQELSSLTANPYYFEEGQKHSLFLDYVVHFQFAGIALALLQAKIKYSMEDLKQKLKEDQDKIQGSQVTVHVHDKDTRAEDERRRDFYRLLNLQNKEKRTADLGQAITNLRLIAGPYKEVMEGIDQQFYHWQRTAPKTTMLDALRIDLEGIFLFLKKIMHSEELHKNLHSNQRFSPRFLPHQIKWAIPDIINMIGSSTPCDKVTLYKEAIYLKKQFTKQQAVLTGATPSDAGEQSAKKDRIFSRSLTAYYLNLIVLNVLVHGTLSTQDTFLGLDIISWRSQLRFINVEIHDFFSPESSSPSISSRTPFLTRQEVIDFLEENMIYLRRPVRVSTSPQSTEASSLASESYV